VSIEYYKLGGCLPPKLPLTIHEQVSIANFTMDLPSEKKITYDTCNMLAFNRRGFCRLEPILTTSTNFAIKNPTFKTYRLAPLDPAREGWGSC